MRLLTVLLMVSFSLLVGCVSTATPGPAPSGPSPTEAVTSSTSAPSEINKLETYEPTVSLIGNGLQVIVAVAAFIGATILFLRRAHVGGLDNFDIALILAMVGLFAAVIFSATRL